MSLEITAKRFFALRHNDQALSYLYGGSRVVYTYEVQEGVHLSIVEVSYGSLIRSPGGLEGAAETVTRGVESRARQQVERLASGMHFAAPVRDTLAEAEDDLAAASVA